MDYAVPEQTTDVATKDVEIVRLALACRVQRTPAHTTRPRSTVIIGHVRKEELCPYSATVRVLRAMKAISIE